jgi:autotransporter-associated beta strand protein
MSTASVSISGSGTFETSAPNILADTITVTLSGSGVYSMGGSDTIGTITGSGGSVSLGANTLTTSANTTSTFSGTLGGTGGGLTKSGSGTLELAGPSANTHTGTTTVSGGTLQLNKTAGVNAIAGAVSVGSTATLLISESNQVADGAAVTLSGGTIQRGTGTVSEVFGNLNLTAASFLNYAASGVGSLQFGTYTPSQLLTVSNFREGSTLVFGSNIGAAVLTNPARFSFDNAFTSNWNPGTSTFTITAIPEPSTVVAALGLAGLMLWPARRRLVRDATSILGLRTPMRDRLASRNHRA